MLRLFTWQETDKYLAQCRNYIVQEFGEENCSSLQHWRQEWQAGNHIRQPYGDFASSPPVLYGMATAIFISHAELDSLKQHDHRDIEIHPWKPEDGKAVLWVSSIVSHMQGVAAQCISGLADQIERHPYVSRIDTLAVFCTGPQGYMMSEAFGLHEAGFYYQDGWPFMERPIQPDRITEISSSLQAVWSMTKARDVAGRGIERWGPGWKRQTINEDEIQ